MQNAALEENIFFSIQQQLYYDSLCIISLLDLNVNNLKPSGFTVLKQETLINSM